MPHPSNNGYARALPRAWVLHLLWLFHAQLWQLNAQLTLPPDPRQPFLFGVHPEPLPKRLAPRSFQQALNLGRDPSTKPFQELKDPDERRYNLFIRVAQYVPGSEDWLFKPLQPYLRLPLPSVAYSSGLATNLLARLHLKRASEATTLFALKINPESVRAREDAFIRALVARPDPIHLVLLIALFHEREWHYPESEEARRLCDACHEACRNFTCREKFSWSSEVRPHEPDIGAAIWAAIHNVNRFGHRSMPPTVQDRDWFGPGPHGLARLGIIGTRENIFCDSTEWLGDADECAGLAAGIPIYRFFNFRRTAYVNDVYATPSEARKALADVMAAAALPADRLRRYDRDPSVLAQIRRAYSPGSIGSKPYVRVGEQRRP